MEDAQKPSTLNLRVSLVIAFLVSLVAALLSWYVFLSESSAQNSLFFMGWFLLNIVPAFFSMLGGHAGSLSIFVLGTAFQWFLIGCIITRVIAARRK